MPFHCISPKTLLLRLSSNASSTAQPPSQVISLLVPRFFISSSSSSNAGSGLRAGYYSPRRLQEEESRGVRVSVWWDFEDCNLPVGANGFKVAQAITAVIRSIGVRGPITITAFGNLLKLSKVNQNELSSSGINLQYVPQGGKTSGNLIRWASQNPPPAHIFLISSDWVFANALHKLRRNNYNILLASKTYEPDVLSSAAAIMWDWCSLVERKSLTGVYFNLPRYAPYIPWIPLQDQLAAGEQSNYEKIEESTASNSNLNTEDFLGLSKTPRCLRKEESQNVSVCVLWDFENCDLPVGANVCKVAPAIAAAIRTAGMGGPITIIAFGDVSRLSTTNRKVLSSTGINLRNVCPGETTVHMALLTELFDWVFLNPPPAHLFLISTDDCFASVLHQMRMRNYNILLASEAHAPAVLCSAATIMWDWPRLVQGGNVSGRLFNQPPVGPWYGCYRIPLQDAFAADEQSNWVKAGESLASNSNMDFKVGLFPLTRGFQKEIDKSRSPGFFRRILKSFKFWERHETAAKLDDEQSELGDDVRSK